VFKLKEFLDFPVYFGGHYWEFLVGFGFHPFDAFSFPVKAD